ncbi:DUF805 domain-containing protein [Altererythrobacter arenosus]|uniref:DUF805 domain-containing protein n=1 Tax=Altererythrobacter arenosus TaxID=3032592 RepID=A0ABY8FN63_9SPHN|nr:DUF805 domain-containing protein [Altererythrobacter sp. CAU 1644]WFL76469.1 DUF805 domain-containing protein [Altererythrobacter sp. CAU 1644]
MEYMFLPFKRYFDFQGRSRRKEYWLFTLLNVVVIMGLLLVSLGGAGLAAVADPDASEMETMGAIFGGGLGILVLLWVLAVFIPSIAVTVRRFHDRDMSGWWYLGFLVGGMIPYIGFIVSIALLVIMALPGTPGPNRFGPDPKNPTSADVFE